MGLPQTIINFQTLAASLIQRTQNGIVALILKDDTATKDLYTYTSIDQVVASDLWSDANKDLIQNVFMGAPSKVYVARVGTAAPTLTTALATLGNKLWDYIAYPGGIAGDMTTISTWIKGKRDVDKKTYKSVLSGVAADHEGVINFTTTGIGTEDGKTYTALQFTGRIAGILAGVGTEGSVTNLNIPEVVKITDLADDTARSAAIDNGELILVNNGEDVVIARGVNSLKSTSTAKGAIFKKTRIVEIVDTMRDDIVSTINKDYRGKVLNTYANKLLLIAAINSYFGNLERENVLDPEFDNLCEIDYEAQRLYLSGLGIKVEDMTKEQILKYNTQDQVFLKCNIKTVDAMEDFHIQVYI